MKKKFLLSFILTAISIIAFGVIGASAATESDLSYYIYDGAAIIDKCDTSATGDLIIPSTLDGLPVTEISSYAFSDCSGLSSITIPDSITYIGFDAFSGCTGLTSVNITDITAWCNIDFSYYESNPLYYAPNLYLNDKLVTDLVLPYDVKEIKKYAFSYYNGLKSVEIPGSVTSIGYYAFGSCENLTKAIISDGVTTICDEAFSSSGLKSIVIPDR